jgi:pyridoxine 5-phosphate synthase
VAIPGINELNIGHSIIARAFFTGLDQAVRDMRAILDKA